MVKTVKIKLFLFSSLAIILFISTFFIYKVTVKADSFSDIKAKITGISEEQSQTLKKLFTLAQEIKEAEDEENRSAGDIEKVKIEIEGLQKTIDSEETAYAKREDDLKQVLKVYQRMGPGSYMEILLKSDSLPDLLRRINTLRDLTRDTGGLLDDIKENREKQSADKAKLSKELSLMEEKQKVLQQAIAKKKQTKEAMESYLTSLAEKRGQYQEYLDGLQKTWNTITPFFSKVVKDFSDQMENGGFPQDSLKINFNLFDIKASIDDKTINSIITANPQFPKMAFYFHPGKVEISVPEKNLTLMGKFVISDKHSLKFEAEEGSFFGMPLETGSIKELFQQGDLVFDFGPQLGSLSLASLEIMDGHLDLSVKP